jgi:hypothetical protein
MSDILDKDSVLCLAKHNESISKSLKETDLAWSSIIMFYSSVHWINFYYFKKDYKFNIPNKHSERDKFVANYAPKIYKSYKHLYDASQIYRYHPPAWEKITDSDYKFICEKFEDVRKFVNS